MTEKRFTVPEYHRCIQDNLTKKYYICEDRTEAIDLAYLLNELAEENEQLVTKCHDLKDENERLKQEKQLLYENIDLLKRFIENQGFKIKLDDKLFRVI